MFEHILLGIIQGVAEWLPVSSEGMIVLARTHLFPQGLSLDAVIGEALFLHLGTLLAAGIYFRKDICDLSQALLRWKDASDTDKKTVSFLIVATLISGGLGLVLLKGLFSVAQLLESSTRAVTVIVGCCLLVTAVMQIKAPRSGGRAPVDLTLKDSVLLGLAQGFAALPGLSRSGLTVSALLLLRFDKAQALRLSFLMSIPIVLLGNIFKGLLDGSAVSLSGPALTGLVCSFVFGLGTIHVLLWLAQRIHFGYFVFGFGILTIASAWI